jgi:toxin ParE1/3/4
VHKLELSDFAKEDIRDISAYTVYTYGEAQANRYIANLWTALQDIVSNPLLGHWRPDIPTEYKALRTGRHIIVYCFRDNSVFIARILHDTMEMGRHL